MFFAQVKMKSAQFWIKVGVIVILSIPVYASWKETEPDWRIRLMDFREPKEATPEGNAMYVHELASLGERAIWPIIYRIEDKSSWSRATVLLPYALGEIGGEAKQQLKLRIQQYPLNTRSPETIQKIYLIYTLQKAFDDYSFAEDWYTMIGRHQGTQGYLERQLLSVFNDNNRPFPKDGKLSKSDWEWLKKQTGVSKQANPFSSP